MMSERIASQNVNKWSQLHTLMKKEKTVYNMIMM